MLFGHINLSNLTLIEERDETSMKLIYFPPSYCSFLTFLYVTIPRLVILFYLILTVLEYILSELALRLICFLLKKKDEGYLFEGIKV